MSAAEYRCSECAIELPRKALRHHCQSCRALLCGKHIYSWIDGNNRAITKASPDLCERCYRERYDTATVEQAATELLKAQVFAAYQSRKFTAIWDLFEMQIALNTELEGIRQQAHERTVRERARISELKATNAALVEFLAVSRELDALGTVTEDSPIELLERWREIAERYAVINHSLATDHGIPLPGEDGQ